MPSDARRPEHRRRLELVTFLGLLVVVFVAKFPALDLPYYWDEFGYVTAVNWLSGESLVRALPGFRPADAFWGHPPGLHVMLAVLFKGFGPSRSLAHLLIVGFAFVGVYFTYRLGALIYDRPAGIYAALALFLCPVYFAQSAMFLADIPVAALGVTAVYLSLRGRDVGYLVTASALVLVKETGAAVVAALVLVRLWNERGRLRQARYALLRDAAPLLILGGFLGWQKLVAGEFFFIFAETPFKFIDVGWAIWWRKLCELTLFLFWDQWRFVLSALILVGLVWQQAGRRELLLFALIVVASAYPFVFIYFLRRYLLPALPFFYVAGLGALTTLLPSRRWQVSAVAVMLALSVVSLADRRVRGNGEWDMSYLSVIGTAQSMYRYLGATYPGSRVASAWPDNVNLVQPELGYVDKPMKDVEYRGEPALASFDVLLVSWPSAGYALRQYALGQVAQGTLRLEKRVENEGAFSELYVKASEPTPRRE